eukprot:40217-Chlamydomonas_euryale.AAC.4
MRTRGNDRCGCRATQTVAFVRCSACNLEAHLQVRCGRQQPALAHPLRSPDPTKVKWSCERSPSKHSGPSVMARARLKR